MRSLLAPTEDFIKLEKAVLTADASAGSSAVLTVENSDGFDAHDFIVVGVEGSEGAELCQISAVSPTSITVATLVLNHKEDEPITKYRYDKRKFYGATTATGSYSELVSSGSPVAIQVGDPQGAYLEYIGTDGYLWFKSTYYNSYTTDETSLTDATAALADESVRYASLYAIRKHAGLAGNPRYSDSRLETKRKQAENEINSAIAAKYALPLSEVPPLLSQILRTPRCRIHRLRGIRWRRRGSQVARERAFFAQSYRHRRSSPSSATMARNWLAMQRSPCWTAIPTTPTPMLSSSVWLTAIDMYGGLSASVEHRRRAATLSRAPRYGIEHAGLLLSLQGVCGHAQTDLFCRRIQQPRRSDRRKLAGSLAGNHRNESDEWNAKHTLHVGTGKMRDSFTTEVSKDQAVIGNSAAYFKYHQSKPTPGRNCRAV